MSVLVSVMNQFWSIKQQRARANQCRNTAAESATDDDRQETQAFGCHDESWLPTVRPKQVLVFTSILLYMGYSYYSLYLNRVRLQTTLMLQSLSNTLHNLHWTVFLHRSMHCRRPICGLCSTVHAALINSRLPTATCDLHDCDSSDSPTGDERYVCYWLYNITTSGRTFAAFISTTHSQNIR